MILVVHRYRASYGSLFYRLKFSLTSDHFKNKNKGKKGRHNRALRVAQAVPDGEAHRTKMSDVHAEHAPGGLMYPTLDPWGMLG